MPGAAYMEVNLDRPVSYALNRIQERLLKTTTYFGVKAVKSPLDAWIYQEIICEIQPDVIVEIGTCYGGGTLYLAHLCDALDHGKVISIDIDQSRPPAVVREHTYIELIESDACQAFPSVCALVPDGASVVVIEDSSHTFENTLNVLRTYQELIQPGGYFIVEDGICYHGLEVGPMPGPYEAVEQFLTENSDFVADRSREDFFLTWNPKGFLRRVEA